MTFLDPVILFFILGAFSGLVKSDLRIPKNIYTTLSAYLLLAIGIKGGIELSQSETGDIFLPALGAILLGMACTYSGYLLLKKIWRFDGENSIAIATHYGSVSAVTFAVVISYFDTLHGHGAILPGGNFNPPYESFMTVLLVLMEIPGIILGIALSIFFLPRDKPIKMKKFLHDVFLGKSILLLLGGLFIGLFIGHSGNQQLNFFFIDLFKGFLAIFMLELGVVTSERMGDLKKVGIKLISFGLFMPFVGAVLGIFTGYFTGLTIAGTTILATLAASASYIAAPAAVRIAIPNANPTFFLTAALGITFPFNIIVGIPIYHFLTKLFFNLF